MTGNVIYKYNENYLVQSVHSFLLKIFFKKLFIAVCVKDPQYWDQILWNRDFLPHGMTDHKYQRILICDQEYINPAKRMLMLIYTSQEEINSYIEREDQEVIFMPCNTIYNSISAHKVYTQDNNGKWHADINN